VHESGTSLRTKSHDAASVGIDVALSWPWPANCRCSDPAQAAGGPTAQNSPQLIETPTLVDHRRVVMRTLAQSLYLDSEFGSEQELPRAGSALENRYVFDAAARELESMAERGMIEIVARHVALIANESLVDRLSFRRLR
jgi:hypothetical protein